MALFQKYSDMVHFLYQWNLNNTMAVWWKIRLQWLLQKRDILLLINKVFFTISPPSECKQHGNILEKLTVILCVRWKSCALGLERGFKATLVEIPVQEKAFSRWKMFATEEIFHSDGLFKTLKLDETHRKSVCKCRKWSMSASTWRLIRPDLSPSLIITAAKRSQKNVTNIFSE